MWWIGFHAIMFWFLFWDFYKASYLGKRSASQTKKRPLAFLACSPTESFLNQENDERELDIEIRRRVVEKNGKSNGYSKELQQSRNGVELNGKDL